MYVSILIYLSSICMWLNEIGEKSGSTYTTLTLNTYKKGKKRSKKNGSKIEFVEMYVKVKITKILSMKLLIHKNGMCT